MQNPGIIAFTVIVMLFGIYLIFEGVRATITARSNGGLILEPWPITFQHSPYTKVGALMLRSFFILAVVSSIFVLGKLIKAALLSHSVLY